MSFAGIDFNTTTIDVIRLDEEGTDATHLRWFIQAPIVNAFEAARRVREALPSRGAWRDGGVVMVSIEQPFSNRFHTAVALARVQGAILACLPADLDVLPLTPQEWKRETVGQTNATKPAVRAWVYKTCPRAEVERWSQDGCDAYAIAWAARALCERAAAA